MGFDISDQLMGVSEALVEETVNKAIAVEFFDKGLYEKFKILTSKGIQERFKEAVRKREKILVREEFWISSAGNSISGAGNTQSKVKEIKVKERERIPPTPFFLKNQNLLIQ